jgi:uncharacterized protein YbgA (DUF1722 family)/uncharacterized protein YbbK (DUF523 family)
MKKVGGLEDPIRIGISACLLGDEVRFDGGHKRDRFLTDILGPFVEWVPVCPEVEAGFGVPREPMRLVSRDGDVRLLTVRTGIDVTERMRRFSRTRVEALDDERLSGYVLKNNSPSCGMTRVKVYSGSVPSRTGSGLFAAALRSRFPHLPVEEEGRLSDPRLRDNFIERVFAYRRVRELFAGRWTVGALVRFHTAHKLTLMAHSPKAYNELGRLVAHAATTERRDLETRYVDGFMTALATIATPRRHVNVLQHATGYFKKLLDEDSRAELRSTIDDYRQGLIPLIVPITLVRHHARHYRVSYLAGQTYLEPHRMMMRAGFGL